MLFTSGQLALLIVFTEFTVYAILASVMNAIKHCATLKAYTKVMNGVDVSYSSESVEEIKEEE